MTTYLRFFNYDEAFKYYCGLIDKVLNVFKEEKNKCLVLEKVDRV